jgi:glycosyltransferase involved in cell wall biosynthesis
MSSYINNFIRHLIEVDQLNEYLLLVDKNLEEVDISKFEIIQVPDTTPVLQMAWIQSILPNVLRRKGIKIYHSLKHAGPIYCPVISIYTIAAVGQYCGIYPLTFQERIYWTQLQRMILKNADFVVAHTNFIRNFIIEHLNIPQERTATIYNGSDEYYRPISDREDLQQFLTSKELKQPFLLCVGNVVPVKNYKTLLRAYKLLVDSSKINGSLVIAGGTSHPHFLELKDLITELKLQESVKFVGHLSKQELLWLYNCAELLVHPSLHEGFCAAIIEAMACGVPIICSKSTSLPEIVGDAAIFYREPEDAEELANKIEIMISSKIVQDTLSEKAQKRVKQFSWNKCVQETIELYDKLAFRNN